MADATCLQSCDTDIWGGGNSSWVNVGQQQSLGWPRARSPGVLPIWGGGGASDFGCGQMGNKPVLARVVRSFFKIIFIVLPQNEYLKCATANNKR
jgi:hypothetical protein